MRLLLTLFLVLSVPATAGKLEVEFNKKEGSVKLCDRETPHPMIWFCVKFTAERGWETRRKSH